VIEDFGYSATNHARGKSAGEIGGDVVRSSRLAYYLKPLGRELSLDDPLHSTGQFVVKKTGGTSTIYFGWFNSKKVGIGTYPTDTLHIRFNGEARGVDMIVNYITSKNEGDGGRVTGFGPGGQKKRDFNLIPLDTVYTYDFRYDPAANNDNGRITFTLGGDGPYTVKDYVIDLNPKFRKTGARFDSFGIVNAKAEPGGTLAIFFDDMTLGDQPLAFDDDPRWKELNNHAAFDDYLKRGVHDFGYQPDSNFAGGQKGEIGGILFSDNGGYYGDDIGRLTLDDRLVASGKLALKERGSEAGFYLGWFNSEGRGRPPKNLLGVFAEGPNSVGSLFRPLYATSDPAIGAPAKSGPVINQTGKPHAWRIEYDPEAAGGHGEITVSLDGETATLQLPPEARKQNALFNRFGLAINEGGGQYSTVYLDDLQYTTNR
jgi:hypothetical protein